jgi:acyl-coenzyme A synthetase/AMP-(fatty) acid ligase
VKSVIFGPRRAVPAGRETSGTLDSALAPAVVAGCWQVPGKFNFTRDVVEVLARDTKARALTFLGRDGVIEPRTFLQLAHGAAGWAATLREHGVGPGDRVLILEGTSPDWIEIMLAGIKIGAVTVPCAPELSTAALDIRIAATGARVVVASRAAQAEFERSAPRATVLYVDDVRRQAHRLPTQAPSHDTSARDPAFIVSTAGRTNGPRGVLHTHASTFAARAHAEHWLDAGLGDVVWCTAGTDSAQALWSTLLGPWSRGASVVLHDGPFDPVERLDLLHRLGVTVLCQTPAEYRALAETNELARYRWARPRRLVSTGADLPDELIVVFEEQWGLTIHDGYGQAEIGVVVGHGTGDGFRAGSVGRPLPGYEAAVVDERGNELPPGYEGDLALRGNPPSLFAGYWNDPDETNAAYRGDWYVTGDVAVRDDDGFLWLHGRTGNVARRDEPVAHAIDGPADKPEASAPTVVPGAPPARVDAVVVERAEPAPAKRPSGEGSRLRRVPLLARITGTLWLVALGVLIGGVAIPHAQDIPRVVPSSEDVPNSICLPPAPPK